MRRRAEATAAMNPKQQQPVLPRAASARSPPALCYIPPLILALCPLPPCTDAPLLDTSVSKPPGCSSRKGVTSYTLPSMISQQSLSDMCSASGMSSRAIGQRGRPEGRAGQRAGSGCGGGGRRQRPDAPLPTARRHRRALVRRSAVGMAPGAGPAAAAQLNQAPADGPAAGLPWPRCELRHPATECWQRQQQDALALALGERNRLGGGHFGRSATCGQCRGRWAADRRTK